MRLKEYTSLPKSADVSFKMTHLPKFCGFQILKTSIVFKKKMVTGTQKISYSKNLLENIHG